MIAIIPATMFLSVIDSLPPTSYIKMVEIWLIYMLLIPFKEVIIISFIHHKTYAKVKPEEEKKFKEPKALKIALIFKTYFIPLSFLLFVTIYWVVGLIACY